MTKTRTTPRAPMRMWAKVLLWTAGITATLGGLSVLFMAAMLSGGFDDMFNQPGPYETDKKVVQALSQTMPENEAKLNVLVAKEVAAALTVRPNTLARGAESGCIEGQHNWKRDDGFDLACTLSNVIVIEGDMNTFQADMIALNTSLVAAGWNPSDLSLDDIMRDYWDQRESFPTTAASSQDYSPSDLPSARYTTLGYEHTLSVGWTDRQEPQLSLPGYGSSSRVVWTAPGLGPDVRPIDLLSDDSRYGLIIRLEQTYFEE